MFLTRRRSPGFTLVELMIVVAIIGVLAALAIYGVSRYLKHAKTAEATRNLGSIETGSKNSFQQEFDSGGSGTGPYVHQFCSTTGAVYNPNPSYPPPAAKLKVDPTTWAAAPWTCLQFTINEPQFFSYGYVSSGSGTAALYTAVANGDLDGNGVLSTFTLSGSGGPTGDAQRLAFTVVNEDE